MKILICFCFLCFSFSVFAQQDTTKNNSDNRDLLRSARRDSSAIARRDSAFTSRRDSIITTINAELNVPKRKMESALAVFSMAADSINQVANNDELVYDDKSAQIKSIADNRDATLKSMLNDNQLARLKAYIIRRKIPKKIN